MIRRKRIAVVGGGVSGLVSAWLLAREHDVILFEAENRLGGHAHTVDVQDTRGSLAVDTGFIVFNEENYPYFTAMLRRLGVPSQASDMSFSVRDDAARLEYCASSLGQLFGQRSNLFRPRIYRMLRGILRFHELAPGLLRSNDETTSLADWLEQVGLRGPVVEHYLRPMAAALWSTDPAAVLQYPARFFVAFFDHHRFLQIRGRPTWRTVSGGSRQYVQALLADTPAEFRRACPVERIERSTDGARVVPIRGTTEQVDEVVLACHSDQALRLLAEPSDVERQVLGAMRYAANDTVLHTDRAPMPRREKLWASWNYRMPAAETGAATVSYWMNRLQSLPTDTPWIVSLNETDTIDPERIHGRYAYDHPQYTPDFRAAQRRRDEIQGRRNTWFCGAYWGWGFHEDGVRSAYEMVDAMQGAACPVLV